MNMSTGFRHTYTILAAESLTEHGSAGFLRLEVLLKQHHALNRHLRTPEPLEAFEATLGTHPSAELPLQRFPPSNQEPH
uniref:Uncharacterized protein n=1 Tax=Salix viminalis TaxID=40686 RepID=A0A6N2K9U6_SALVM